MSDTNFTKGEWKFNAHDGSITDTTPAENVIAQVEVEDFDNLDEGYANGYVLAQSNAMYAMLEELANHQEYDLAKEINELLAQARGEA